MAREDEQNLDFAWKTESFFCVMNFTIIFIDIGQIQVHVVTDDI